MNQTASAPGGMINFMGYLLGGIIQCVTIVGIPSGI